MKEKTEKIEVKLEYLYRRITSRVFEDEIGDILEIYNDLGDYEAGSQEKTMFPMQSVSIKTGKTNAWNRYVRVTDIEEIGKIEDHPEYFI